MAISESIQLGLMGAGSIVVALLACENKLDNDKLTKGITNMFDEQLELEVKEVECPKDVKVEKGKEFECDVKVKPKGTVPVTVTITSDGGDVEMKTKYEVLIPKTVKEKLGKQFGANFKDIDCGKEVQLVKPGEKIKCTATDATGAKKTMTISVNDEEELDFKIE
jgi:hypothetical protein